MNRSNDGALQRFIIGLRCSIVAATLILCASPVVSKTDSNAKRRVLVLTDIGNEPDDSESFVRLLVYSNEFDVEGLVATTSTWQRRGVHPHLLVERIDGYAKVLANLRRHADGYPDPEALRSVVRAGASTYGMAGVGEGRDTDGSRQIIDVVDRVDSRPVYLAVWGGAADLAQALWTVRHTRTPAQVQAFLAKLRVHSISDQDDCGPWIRQNFPTLFWIASVHGWGQYRMAAWIGISGDLSMQSKWPASETVTNAWIQTNIRRGPLGTLYPPHIFMMEGDTPSFLGLIRNGINDPEHPEWGGWGGRYIETYEGAGHRGDGQDSLVTSAGSWVSNQATIFRWRRAFQNDFATRIAWTLSPDRKAANHNPVVVLNDETGFTPVRIKARLGATVTLSATGTRDSDGQRLIYRWWQYAEPSGHPGVSVPSLSIMGANTTEAKFVMLPFKVNADNVPIPKEPFAYHVILEVTDTGRPSLTSYRRAIVSLVP